LSHQVRHVLIHSFDRSIDHDVLPIPTLVVAVNDIQPRRKLMPDDVGWPRLDPAPMLSFVGTDHFNLRDFRGHLLRHREPGIAGHGQWVH
jgi:hypothetical protein